MSARDGLGTLHLAGSVRPNVVLLDVVLPAGNGFQVAEQLRKNPDTAAIPIIFMSGLQHPANAVASRELGALDFLTKALDEGLVRERVRIALGGEGAT